MTLRTKFLITAMWLCHLLLAAPLVTSQLLTPGNDPGSPTAAAQKPTPSACKPEAEAAAHPACVSAIRQEMIGPVFKLHGAAEIHYANYILRADEVTYNSDTGEVQAEGHLTLDGGLNDDHIRASHGTYNLTTESGRFYDVTGTTGLRLRGNRVVLTSTAPFAFTGKIVEKTGPDHYLVYDGTITTCESPHPKWKFEAHKVVVDVGGNAKIYRSTFALFGLPFLYFPFATHPVERQARESGILTPTLGRSSSNGNVIGDSFYWAINRSLDATAGAQYFSRRGWSPRAEFRARPSDNSYVDLNYFAMFDRGIGTPRQNQGGENVRLNAEGNIHGFRSVATIDYLSSFLFRLAFNEVFNQAVYSEVKSQAFVSKSAEGFIFSGMVERYQNFFQTINPDGTLSNPPKFDSVQILHAPSFDASSADRQVGQLPLYWSFDASLGGLARSEPGFQTSNLLGRFDLIPQISLPLLFRGWSLRPELALHETFYTDRFVNGIDANDPTNRQALEAGVELRPPTLEKVFGKEFLGRKWKHAIEPRAVYRLVTGVNDFANVLHFDERDILSNTHEVGYGLVTRLYAKRLQPQPENCESQMGGLAVGAPAPEQTVPWQRVSNLQNQPCPPGPAVREVATWEIAQKYFLDPTFGGALVPGQRNVFATTEDLTGIAFLTQPRHLSPLVSRLRVATSARTDTEWDMDYDFQLGRMNSSTLLVNYNVGPFTIGGGDAFLQIPQPPRTATSIQTSSPCGNAVNPSPATCTFQQFRVALGYGNLNRRGFSVASSFGIDAETGLLQFATAQTTYNWDCCGITVEYRRFAIANVRNENLFRFNLSLSNIGSFGNLKRQERLY
jgi:LPS-assembly protein